VYWKWLKREDEKSEGEEQEQRGRVPLLRYYTVFNLTQTEGVPAPAGEARPAFAPIEACERVRAQMPWPPQIEHGGTQAFYQPSRDLVRMPPCESFKTPAAYYATLFHELTHSTGHGSRLNRKGITDAVMFGSHEYSREELIAELCRTPDYAELTGSPSRSVVDDVRHNQSPSRKASSESGAR